MQKDLKEALEGVEARITERESDLLYRLARDCEGGAIVEIGSWKGGSTICLAKGSQKGPRSKVYAIDPHELGTEPDFRKNIRRAGVEDIVIPIKMKSAEAARNWTEPIGVLWIDGAHDYESVRNDILLYGHFLRDGGVIALHDTITGPGVKKALRKYVFGSNSFVSVESVDITTFAVKANVTARLKLLKRLKVLFWYMMVLSAILEPVLKRLHLFPLAHELRGRIQNMISSERGKTGT